MDSSSIELPGSRISAVELKGTTLRIVFDPAYLIRTMTGSAERTRWHQQGTLVFEQAELLEELPALPAVSSGGDVGENVYTYRDMIPVPLASQGRAHCLIRVEGDPRRIRIEAAAVRLDMEESARYIEHIRPGAAS